MKHVHVLLYSVYLVNTVYCIVEQMSIRETRNLPVEKVTQPLQHRNDYISTNNSTGNLFKQKTSKV